MGFLRSVLFACWSFLNMIVAGGISFLLSIFMSVRYDEMHTLSTALDPDPNLTREMVISNVTVQTVGSAIALAVVAIVFWGVNSLIYPTGSPQRKMGAVVSCLCTLTLFVGLVAADYYCLTKYPSPA